MRKIAIVTDSNSGITQDEGRKLGISVLPMPFYINDVMYLEGITLSQEAFYERLKNDESISTSQPSPAEVCGLWDNLLEEYDEIVHIPMSSGLSASCDTATMLARDYDGRVQVVNNQRISVTQRQSVLDAIALRDAGKNAAEIIECCGGNIAVVLERVQRAAAERVVFDQSVGRDAPLLHRLP